MGEHIANGSESQERHGHRFFSHQKSHDRPHEVHSLVLGAQNRIDRKVLDCQPKYIQKWKCRTDMGRKFHHPLNQYKYAVRGDNI